MRRCAYVLLCFCLVLAALSVSAQGAAFPGLNADDAAFLSAANAAFPTRFNFDYTARLAVTGLDSFGLNATFEGAGAIDRAAPALDLTLDGTIQLGTIQSIPVNAALRWLDDTTYLDTGDGWQARSSASSLLSRWISQYAALEAEPAALAQGDFSTVSGLADVVAALSAADPAAYLMAQRLGDEAVGEAETAHFQMSADLHALMQTDAFVDAVADFAATQGNNLVIYSHDELANYVRANSAAFEGAVITVDEFVGLDDGVLRRVVIDLDMPLDPTQLGYTETPFTVSASFDLTLRDGEVSISAPDDARAVDNFQFPAPPAPQPQGAGTVQYVYFVTLGEGESYTQSFEAAAGSQVTITARGLGLDFDGAVTLQSADGTLMAEDDDHENLAFAVGDLDPQVSDFVLAADGTYTVVVSELDGAGGSFVLTITVKPA